MKIKFPLAHAVLGLLNLGSTIVCAAAFNYTLAIICSAIAALNLALWRAAKNTP